jgi:hypothetical protein
VKLVNSVKNGDMSRELLLQGVNYFLQHAYRAYMAIPTGDSVPPEPLVLRDGPSTLLEIRHTNPDPHADVRPHEPKTFVFTNSPSGVVNPTVTTVDSMRPSLPGGHQLFDGRGHQLPCGTSAEQVRVRDIIFDNNRAMSRAKCELTAIVDSAMAGPYERWLTENGHGYKWLW